MMRSWPTPQCPCHGWAGTGCSTIQISNFLRNRQNFTGRSTMKRKNLNCLLLPVFILIGIILLSVIPQLKWLQLTILPVLFFFPVWLSLKIDKYYFIKDKNKKTNNSFHIDPQAHGLRVSEFDR